MGADGPMLRARQRGHRICHHPHCGPDDERPRQERHDDHWADVEVQERGCRAVVYEVGHHVVRYGKNGDGVVVAVEPDHYVLRMDLDGSERRVSRSMVTDMGDPTAPDSGRSQPPKWDDLVVALANMERRRGS